MAVSGAVVILASRIPINAGVVTRVAQELAARPLPLDVADVASVRAVAAAVDEAAGRLDVLVNSAARLRLDSFGRRP